MSTPSVIAVHEAGHVVVGMALKIEVVSADLTPQEIKQRARDRGVEFAFAQKPGEEMPDAVQRKMTFAFAGSGPHNIFSASKLNRWKESAISRMIWILPKVQPSVQGNMVSRRRR